MSSYLGLELFCPVSPNNLVDDWFVVSHTAAYDMIKCCANSPSLIFSKGLALAPRPCTSAPGTNREKDAMAETTSKSHLDKATFHQSLWTPPCKPLFETTNSTWPGIHKNMRWNAKDYKPSTVYKRHGLHVRHPSNSSDLESGAWFVTSVSAGTCCRSWKVHDSLPPSSNVGMFQALLCERTPRQQ